jgi:HEAT repeat protein
MRAFEPLKQLKGDKDEYVRRAAAEAIAKIYKKAGTTPDVPEGT